MVSSIAPPALDTPAAKQLQEAFAKEYPDAVPTQVGSVFGYVQARVTKDILQKACDNNDLTRQGVLTALHQLSGLDTGGLVAGTLDYTKPGQPPSRTVYISQVDASVPGGLKVVGARSRPSPPSPTSRHERRHVMRISRLLAALVPLGVVVGLVGPAGPAAATTAPSHVEGVLPDGSAYVMDVPANWNGAVLLYSHGYVPDGAPNPAQQRTQRRGPVGAARRRLRADRLVVPGDGLGAGAGPARPAGHAGRFRARFGSPRRTIAWGTSLGGMITTGLAERYGHRFAGTLAMCGLEQGGVANWNNTLDPLFALRTLLAPGSDNAAGAPAGPAGGVRLHRPADRRARRGAGDAGGPGPHRARRGAAQHSRVDRRRAAGAARRATTTPPSSTSSACST